MFVTVKSTGDPSSLAQAVRSEVRSMAPAVPVMRMQTMEEILSASMASAAFTMTLVGIAAMVALLLGTIGIYGVISYVVSQRTREIGVRMALGAATGDVSRMVVRQGMVLTGGGLVLGLGGALVAMRLLESVLFEVGAVDATAYGVGALLLAVTATLASYLPARRAAGVDPMEALRGE